MHQLLNDDGVPLYSLCAIKKVLDTVTENHIRDQLERVGYLPVTLESHT